MIEWVLVEANVRVAAADEGRLVAAYHRLIAQPHPDGLLQTELLRSRDGRWRIQTLWRDRTSMDVMRTSPKGPTAPRLFHDLQLEAGPDFDVFEVVDEWLITEPENP